MRRRWNGDHLPALLPGPWSRPSRAGSPKIATSASRVNAVPVPLATYRLQFREGFDFAAAIEVVPYLRALGVSHLYASPIFTAPAGSTHGYDVADHNEIDPALGGRAGFERLAEALRAAGLGLILDIVPNHMAASLQNPWWRSVVEWGRQSPFAGHFDIDWERRLTLPILGRPYDEALAQGELGLDFDGAAGFPVLRYFDNRLPLHPSTWAHVLGSLDLPLARRLREMAARAAGPSGLRDREARDACAGAEGEELARQLRALSAPGLVDTVHRLQPWELTFWKDARRSLSYRRFFEVTGLVGVRVDQPHVFDDVHRLTLELVRLGVVDGLRIDHVDGLADPGGYLRRLRREAGPETTIVVEKILARGEELPVDWPVQGTTGYEFIDALAGLLADDSGVSRLASQYRKQTGAEAPEHRRREAKRQIAAFNFEGEVSRLAGMIAGLRGDVPPDARAEAPLADIPADDASIRAALVELLAAMPAYRTYNQLTATTGWERATLDRALEEATRAAPQLRATLRVIHATLAGLDTTAGPLALSIRQRFQQLSGPVMAKSVEDTLFYRHHAFVALNEVGCDPVEPTPSLDDFHRAMAARASRSAHSLSATATHDTKRGEDARARLLALSEMPDAWCEAVEIWRSRLATHLAGLPGGAAPDPETEWLIFQALAGAWPSPSGPAATDADGLRERFTAFLRKALREAKLRTSWTETDEEYEAAVEAYAVSLFDDASFMHEMDRLVRPLALAGWRNSMAQTAAKLLAPGIPDIYQGSEAADFSFVDPDNRRPVDFARLARRLDQGSEADPASIKQRLVARLLGLRRAMPALFAHGDYLPLQTAGPQQGKLAAFARLHGDQAVIAMIPRNTLELLGPEGDIAPEVWRGTRVLLPEALHGCGWEGVVGGGEIEAAQQAMQWLDAEAVLGTSWPGLFVGVAKRARS